LHESFVARLGGWWKVSWILDYSFPNCGIAVLGHELAVD
jgi:hypothetical protein